MKILICKFLVSVIIATCISCNNKQQNQNTKSEDKPIIVEYKSHLEEYCNEENKPIRYPLLIKKIVTPEKTMYLYSNKNYRVDSLVFFKDSVLMNNEKLLLLKQKTINYRGKKQDIKKYQYLHRSSNIFTVESLGIILQHGQTHPYGTVRRDYNPEKYHTLCNEIMKDSLFYSFEFDLKNLKEVFK